MIIAIDRGHGVGPDRGAKNEEYLIDMVANQIEGHLQNLGHKVIKCKPTSASTVSESLNKRCLTANQSGAKYFISLHCNAFDSKAHGSEIFTYDGKDKMGARATLKEYEEIGFTNRGVKKGDTLAVLRGTSMPAMLVEFCFGDNEADKKLMEKNYDKMARILISNLLGVNIRLLDAKPSTPSSGPTKDEIKKAIKDLVDDL